MAFDVQGSSEMVAFRMNAFNWSAHADTQHQGAASQRVLRAGGLGR